MDDYYSCISRFLNSKDNSNFYELRKAGENDSPICQLIQKDLIKEFIVYVNKNNTPLNSLIEPSIYETNSFLNSKQFCVTCDFNLYEYLVKRNDNLSLINYAAFFGSIQIFNY